MTSLLLFLFLLYIIMTQQSTRVLMSPVSQWLFVLINSNYSSNCSHVCCAVLILRRLEEACLRRGRSASQDKEQNSTTYIQGRVTSDRPRHLESPRLGPKRENPHRGLGTSCKPAGTKRGVDLSRSSPPPRRHSRRCTNPPLSTPAARQLCYLQRSYRVSTEIYRDHI